MPKKGAHEGEVFLVAPHMRDLLSQHTVSATLYFLMTAEGAPLVAPVPLPGDGDKEHTAHSSFRIIAARAEKEWCLASIRSLLRLMILARPMLTLVNRSGPI